MTSDMTDDTDDTITPAGASAPTRGRLADVVHVQLRRLIQRGEFPRGLKLPAETDLAQRFGVSRPVVREALAWLRDEGYVQSHKGSGTIVVHEAAPATPGIGLPEIRTMADLVRFYEFRIGVEGATAALAAERRNDADLRAMEAALASADEMLADQQFALLADVNFTFHRAIARATQNPYYATTLETLPNFVGRNMLDGSRRADPMLFSRAARIHSEHQTILAAIMSGDALRARVEMERHILAARDAVLEGQALAPASMAGTGS
jgi:DNA-binding FadR family transcriptional regulator